jgi:hypothetical protein
MVMIVSLEAFYVRKELEEQRVAVEIENTIGGDEK